MWADGAEGADNVAHSGKNVSSEDPVRWLCVTGGGVCVAARDEESSCSKTDSGELPDTRLGGVGVRLCEYSDSKVAWSWPSSEIIGLVSPKFGEGAMPLTHGLPVNTVNVKERKRY